MEKEKKTVELFKAPFWKCVCVFEELGASDVDGSVVCAGEGYGVGVATELSEYALW